MRTIKVLFVCMGNICRSPMAHGVFRRLVEEAGMADRVEVDSAGTHAYHVGEAPDSRAQRTARSRGVELSDLRARQVESIDFERYDYILAMDADNYDLLSNRCPPSLTHKLSLFMDFAPHLGVAEVPDPYYGGPAGFERVLDLVEEAAGGFLAMVQSRHFS